MERGADEGCAGSAHLRLVFTVYMVPLMAYNGDALEEGGEGGLCSAVYDSSSTRIPTAANVAAPLSSPEIQPCTVSQLVSTVYERAGGGKAELDDVGLMP